MTEHIWMIALDRYIRYGTINERSLASLALDLIKNPDKTEWVLDRTASRYLEQLP